MSTIQGPPGGQLLHLNYISHTYLDFGLEGVDWFIGLLFTSLDGGVAALSSLSLLAEGRITGGLGERCTETKRELVKFQRNVTSHFFSLLQLYFHFKHRMKEICLVC